MPTIPQPNLPALPTAVEAALWAALDILNRDHVPDGQYHSALKAHEMVLKALLDTHALPSQPITTP